MSEELTEDELRSLLRAEVHNRPSLWREMVLVSHEGLRARAERAEARVRELENRERIPFTLKDGTVVEYQMAAPKP